MVFVTFYFVSFRNYRILKENKNIWLKNDRNSEATFSLFVFNYFEDEYWG